MSREFIRRSCGHGEAVYVIGPACGRPGRIRAKEREPCGVCRNRRIDDEIVVATAREDGRSDSPETNSVRESIENVLKERERSNDTKKGENS